MPALAAAAAAAGYRHLVSPWAPPGCGDPEAVHRLYSKSLAAAGSPAAQA